LVKAMTPAPPAPFWRLTLETRALSTPAARPVFPTVRVAVVLAAVFVTVPVSGVAVVVLRPAIV